jgi:hypothetical protein
MWLAKKFGTLSAEGLAEEAPADRTKAKATMEAMFFLEEGFPIALKLFGQERRHFFNSRSQ